MKLLLFVVLTFYLSKICSTSNVSDILEKLDSVILNKQEDKPIKEDLSIAIKDLLKVSPKNNKNLKNLIKHEYNETQLLEKNKSNKDNINNILEGYFDPYEMTLKLMKFKEEDEKKKLELNQLKQQYSDYGTKQSKDNIIFDHLYLTNQGKVSTHFIYDSFTQEFIVPEESIYK